jgi:hypothetical protein
MSQILKFNMGTSEYLIVDVTETLGEITELANANFDIYDSDYVGKVVDASNDVIVDGMRVKCLIQPVEAWGGRNDYELYLTLTGLPSAEEPRLGPIRFTVEGYA